MSKGLKHGRDLEHLVDVGESAMEFLVDYLSDNELHVAGRVSFDNLHEAITLWLGPELDQLIEEAKLKKLAENGP